MQREKYEKIQEKQRKKIDRINRRQLRLQKREESSSDNSSGNEDEESDISSNEEQPPEEEVKVYKRGPYKRRKVSSATESRPELLHETPHAK